MLPIRNANGQNPMNSLTVLTRQPIKTVAAEIAKLPSEPYIADPGLRLAYHIDQHNVPHHHWTVPRLKRLLSVLERLAEVDYVAKTERDDLFTYDRFNQTPRNRLLNALLVDFAPAEVDPGDYLINRHQENGKDIRGTIVDALKAAELIDDVDAELINRKGYGELF